MLIKMVHSLHFLKRNKQKFSAEVKRFLSIGGFARNTATIFRIYFISVFVRSIINVFHMPEEFQKYWYLGTTSSGDPICIIENKKNSISK